MKNLCALVLALIGIQSVLFAVSYRTSPDEWRGSTKVVDTQSGSAVELRVDNDSPDANSTSDLALETANGTYKIRANRTTGNLEFLNTSANVTGTMDGTTGQWIFQETPSTFPGSYTNATRVDTLINGGISLLYPNWTTIPLYLGGMFWDSAGDGVTFLSSYTSTQTNKIFSFKKDGTPSNPSGEILGAYEDGSWIHTHTSRGANFPAIDINADLSSSESSGLRVRDSSGTALFVGNYNNGFTRHPGYLLIYDTTGAFGYYYHGSDQVFRTTSQIANVGTSSGTIVGTQTSDERLKSNIKDLEYGLSTVMSLKPIRFDMQKGDIVRPEIGFGAQTTMPIVPEAVYDTNDPLEGQEGTKLAMEYVRIIAVNTKAIQELKAEKDAEIASLKTAVTCLAAASTSEEKTACVAGL